MPQTRFDSDSPTSHPERMLTQTRKFDPRRYVRTVATDSAKTIVIDRDRLEQEFPGCLPGIVSMTLHATGEIEWESSRMQRSLLLARTRVLRNHEDQSDREVNMRRRARLSNELVRRVLDSLSDEQQKLLVMVGLDVAAYQKYFHPYMMQLIEVAPALAHCLVVANQNGKHNQYRESLQLTLPQLTHQVIADLINRSLEPEVLLSRLGDAQRFERLEANDSEERSIFQEDQSLWQQEIAHWANPNKVTIEWLKRIEMTPVYGLDHREMPYRLIRNFGSAVGGDARLNAADVFLIAGSWITQYASIDQVRNVRNPRQWSLIHEVAVQRPELLPYVLSDVATAVNRVEQYFPPAVQVTYEGRADLQAAVIRNIVDFLASELEEEHDFRREVHWRKFNEKFGTHSFTRLAELAKEWHADPRRHSQGDMISAKFTPVPELHNVALTVKGSRLKLVQMQSTKQLVAEGQRMGNCVSSYAHECSRGDSIILAVRNSKGESVATVSLDSNYSLTEIEGPDNSAADAKLIAAVKQVVQDRRPADKYLPYFSYLESLELEASENTVQMGIGAAD